MQVGRGRRIAVIGVGNMGTALVGGILRSGLTTPENIMAADISSERLAEAKQSWGVNTSADNQGAAQEADIIVLAVKPQVVDSVLENIRNAVETSKTVVSVAAGIKTTFIEERLGEVPVVRAMPNTPALISAGISAICPGRYAEAEHVQMASGILSAVGEVVVVEEVQMDAVTGLSASGPAYVYTMIEALSDGGVKMGLSKEIALKLATQTVLGAARMAAEGGEHPVLLKDRVTSPGGTTIAGLHKLEEKGFRDALISAVEAATRRSEELGKGGA